MWTGWGSEATHRGWPDSFLKVTDLPGVIVRVLGEKPVGVYKTVFWETGAGIEREGAK